MMKQLIHILMAICAAALVSVACQVSEIEEPQNPEEPGKPVVSERTTIPFSLKVSTEATKVSYADGTYQFKEGDVLRVKGVERTDIEGDLSKGEGNTWTGSLSYLTAQGEPGDDTQLEVTLVHADNPDVNSYASGIVGRVPDGSSLLREAVEKYSLFTAQVTCATTSATLQQQAAFLDVTVTFDFDGSMFVNPGSAMVDLVTANGSATQKTAFYQTPGTNDDYDVHFMAVVPGGQSTDSFTLQVSDREITFSTNPTLVKNKKYTVNRTIEFKPQLGDPFWSDGTYGRFSHASGEENVDIVGIIVYVNRHSTDADELALDNAITEATNGGGHALVMALHNASTSGEQWKGSAANKLYTDAINSPQVARSNYISGYYNTDEEYEKCNAASLAKQYADGTNYNDHTTGWFLPSIGQWLYSIVTYGEADPIEYWTDNEGNNYLENGTWNSLIRVKMQSTNTENLLVKKLNDRLELLKTEYRISYDSFGVTVYDTTHKRYVNSDNYWTSSESSASQAIRMNLGSVEGSGPYYSTIKVKPESKDRTWTWYEPCIMKVRPFLAF